MFKIYFLSHPYTPQDGSAIRSPSGLEQINSNVQRSIELTNNLMDKGYPIFNPLTHSHYLDVEKIRDPQFWYALDLEFLKRFDGIIMTPRWENSKGCMKEFQFSMELVRDYSREKPFEILFYNIIMEDE